MPALIPSNSLNYQSLLENEFTLYLVSQHLSEATQKNYRMDIRFFFTWLARSTFAKPLTDIYNTVKLNFITPSVIREFITTQKQARTPLTTINRRLSSLRLFFQCAEAHTWCTNSPMLGIQNIPEPKEEQTLETQFDLFLQEEKSSEKTRKNYRADVQQFFQWLKKTLQTDDVLLDQNTEAILLPQVTSDTVKRYKIDLLASQTPLATINRRLSAIRKLYQFALQKQMLSSDPTVSIHNCKEDVFGNLEKALNTALFQYTQSVPLGTEDTQSIKQFFYWLESTQTYP